MCEERFCYQVVKKTITADRVIESIEALLKDAEAKKRIDTFKEELATWDAPGNAVKILERLVHGRIAH